ncbi:hypothetical protein EVAR_58832_1, partial [Eumeta japonica]
SILSGKHPSTQRDRVITFNRIGAFQWHRTDSLEFQARSLPVALFAATSRCGSAIRPFANIALAGRGLAFETGAC